MTRADIIQILFKLSAEEMDAIKDTLGSHCKNYNKPTFCGCEDCEQLESENGALCPQFWTESMLDDEWENCVKRFAVLSGYSLVGRRNYIKGEIHHINLN